MSTSPPSHTVNPRRRRSTQSGISLIELLVAMTVTVIGLAGLLAVQVATVKANRAGGSLGEANVIGQQTLEQLRSKSIVQIQNENAVLPINNFLMPSVTGRAGQVYNRHLFAEELTAASADLIRLRIEVRWTEQGAAPGAEGGKYDHVLSLELIRTRQEAL